MKNLEVHFLDTAGNCSLSVKIEMKKMSLPQFEWELESHEKRFKLQLHLSDEYFLWTNDMRKEVRDRIRYHFSLLPKDVILRGDPEEIQYIVYRDITYWNIATLPTISSHKIRKLKIIPM